MQHTEKLSHEDGLRGNGCDGFDTVGVHNFALDYTALDGDFVVGLFNGVHDDFAGSDRVVVRNGNGGRSFDDFEAVDAGGGESASHKAVLTTLYSTPALRISLRIAVSSVTVSPR